MRAATRDASWYRSPSIYGKDLVYHVERPFAPRGVSGCGIPIVSTEGYAPVRDVTVAAESVRPEHRCGRPGCRARWPKPETTGAVGSLE